MNNYDLKKYIDIALRRKYWIIIPFLLVIIGGTIYILTTPKIYESKTLILVQQQKVPDNYVRAVISSGIDERLRTITQQVTSRTNLENIIQEFQLYNNSSDMLIPLEEKVEVMRDNIKIDVSGGNRRRGDDLSSFSISFRGKDPKKITEVTNTLASKFISENLKIRESQALGTSQFLADELESIEGRLAEKEEQLKDYQLKYLGEMPDQLNTNLSMLERLQMQLDRLANNLNSVEGRKLIIQQQKAEMEAKEREISLGLASSTNTDRSGNDLVSLRKKLIELEGRYTSNHPDVKRTKQLITNLEAELAESSGSEEAGGSGGGKASRTVFNTAGINIETQLHQADLEIESLKKEIIEVQASIKIYKQRVEDTPRREQELLSIKRDYENLKELYHSMLNRKLEAEIAVSMEKKQKGEQFRVIDPAKIPIQPVEPDVGKLMMIVLALGLGLGCGLAYVRELMDTSFKIPEDLEKELDLPIMVSIPFRYTEKEHQKMKMRKRIFAASVATGFVLSLIVVVLSIKGVDSTLEYVRGMLQ